MGHRIEVMSDGSVDFSVREGLATRRPIRVFNIDDDSLNTDELERIRKLLVDPIVDVATIDRPILSTLPEGAMAVEISPRPAVNDPLGEETRKVISRQLGREIGPVSGAFQHLHVGEMNDTQYTLLTKGLGNPLINEFRRVFSRDWNPDIGVGFHYPNVNLPKPPAFKYIPIDLDEDSLVKLSDRRLFALNLVEMQAIKDMYKDPLFIQKRKEVGLSNESTDAELECIAQTWSEHCCHKRLNAKWIYTSEDPDDESGLVGETNSLFRSIIQDATLKIQKERNIDWIVSVFEDNSGVIRLNDRWNIGHKVETHNHPSSLDGFGGANTGTGGVIRDNVETGIYMEVVSSQWWSNFGTSTFYTDLPGDIQTPFRTLETVIAGVEDYGNKMGIPTMSVNVTFDESYLKCAVGVGGVAVAPAEINGRKTHIKDIRNGYVAITLGGRVGKDGIHGATGSSMDLSSDAESSSQINQSVQIGNPITEKNIFEVQKILAYGGYISAGQDCGAGGWSSALGELAKLFDDLEKKRFAIKKRFGEMRIGTESNLEEKLNAVSDIVDFSKVGSPFADELKYEIMSGDIFGYNGVGRGGMKADLTGVYEKYQGLTLWEKWVSEAQERNVLVIKREFLEKVLEICAHNNVEAVKIAEFNDSGYLEVRDQNQTGGLLPIEFLHRGLPQKTIRAHYTPCQNKEPELPEKKDLTEEFHRIISSPNLQSIEWILTRFDHEVQGGSLVKPIVGKGRGKSDAIAYHPILTEKEVAIESLGSNPLQGDIDAYHMGRNNVVDAIGKIIAVGGNLERITFNGNTLCPNPEKDPEVAAKVMRMLKGSADAEVAFGTPRISGKDSTSMEREYISTKTGKKVRVKARPDLVMSGLGVVDDDSTITTPYFKKSGDVIYVIGETRDELGASEYYQMNGEVGRNVPKSDYTKIKRRFEKLSRAIKEGFVHSCQYVHKGGLAAALSNCAIAGDMGADVMLDYLDNGLGRADKILFSRTTGRFVVSVDYSKAAEFEQAMRRGSEGVYCQEIGAVTENKGFRISYRSEDVVKTNVDTLREKNKGEIKV